ncbi:MAG: DUF1175 family protein [Methylophilaceae bacterium]|nr:DUF1175 family protein [Methylophilaceae bacterium]
MSREMSVHATDIRSMGRRRVLTQLASLFGLAAWSTASLALMPGDAGLGAEEDQRERLSSQKAQAFRSWFQLIVLQQIKQGPTPRWVQRDCAGLVRFAAAEALRSHDGKWLKANGFLAKKTPPELNLTPQQLASLRHAWLRADGSQGAFVSALELVQNNTQLIGKEMAHAEVGDLVLFDQGQAQHLMIWLGKYMAYHTGTVTPDDNGLRAYPLSKLMAWNDTRWQPQASNPNFIGIFRLFFLRAS